MLLRLAVTQGSVCLLYFRGRTSFLTDLPYESNCVGLLWQKKVQSLTCASSSERICIFLLQ